MFELGDEFHTYVWPAAGRVTDFFRERRVDNCRMLEFMQGAITALAVSELNEQGTTDIRTGASFSGLLRKSKDISIFICRCLLQGWHRCLQTWHAIQSKAPSNCRFLEATTEGA